MRARHCRTYFISPQAQPPHTYILPVSRPSFSPGSPGYALYPCVQVSWLLLLLCARPAWCSPHLMMPRPLMTAAQTPACPRQSSRAWLAYRCMPIVREADRRGGRGGEWGSRVSNRIYCCSRATRGDAVRRAGVLAGLGPADEVLGLRLRLAHAAALPRGEPAHPDRPVQPITPSSVRIFPGCSPILARVCLGCVGRSRVLCAQCTRTHSTPQ